MSVFRIFKFSVFLILNLKVGQSYAAETYSFENLVFAIESNRLNSVEATLPFLPEELRQNFVLMSSSASSQQADEINPRVILFGKDAKLIIAFNGSSDQRGSSKFEVIQFRDETQEFEFREIDFKTGQISQKNPDRCLTCHTADSPRPNWAQYSVWQMGQSRAYGFRDDGLYGEEIEVFKNFKASIASHARYKHLLFRKGSEHSPYLKDDDFKGALKFRPNFRFTRYLMILNTQKNLQKIKNFFGSDYSLFRSVLLDTYLTRRQFDYSLINEQELLVAIDRILNINIFDDQDRALINARPEFERLHIIFQLLIKKSSLKPWDMDMNFLADRTYNPESLEDYNKALQYTDGVQRAFESISYDMVKEVISENPELEKVFPYTKNIKTALKKAASFFVEDFGDFTSIGNDYFIGENDAHRFKAVLAVVRQDQQSYSHQQFNLWCQQYLSNP